jgi:tetratricopeptide (TPR) repeat protein
MTGHQKKVLASKQRKAVLQSPAWKAKLVDPAWLSALLAFLTVAVFARVVQNGFVNYDDPDYVTSNSHVQSGLKWENVVWAFRSGFASNWHPLTWLSHMLDCQLFDQSPGSHHLVSLILHVANAVLWLLVLNRMTDALWRSAIVAGFFALHPLHVESVAWVSERKDVLSTFFFLLTLGAYTLYAQNPPPGNRGSRRWNWYGLAIVFFALGLMSKPMLVTIPFVLLLIDYWPLGRIRFSGDESGSSTLETKVKRLLIIEKLPFLGLSLVSCLVTFFVQKKGGAVSPLASLSIGARISNSLVSYVRYIGKFFWPDDLSVLYPHPGHWPVLQVFGAAIFLIGATATVVILARQRPYLLVGWLWFLGTLIPVIGLVQVGIQSMADRYTYIPLTGILFMLVWGVGDVVNAIPQRRSVAAAGCCLALFACALLTGRQVRYWEDSETLFRRTTQVTKDNYLAYNNLGFFLSGKGKADEAMENYHKALEINPYYEDAQNNLGYALAQKKRYAEAIEHYQIALRIRPKNVEVHNNLGNALADTGKIDEAIAEYLFVLGEKPDHADAHNNLGIALSMKGKLDEAIEHFHQAIKFKPKDASAHSNLGNALAVQHKLAEATKEYEECLRLKPEDAQAHNNLGNVLVEQGRLPEAVVQYKRALELNTDNPEAHFNLGFVLARQGNSAEAATHYREALRLKPGYPEAKKQLEALNAR